jgi:hypothetical protein
MLTRTHPAYPNFSRAQTICLPLVSYRKIQKKGTTYRSRTLDVKPFRSVSDSVPVFPDYGSTFPAGGFVSEYICDPQPAFPARILRALDNLCPLARRQSTTHLRTWKIWQMLDCGSGAVQLKCTSAVDAVTDLISF